MKRLRDWFRRMVIPAPVTINITVQGSPIDERQFGAMVLHAITEAQKRGRLVR